MSTPMNYTDLAREVLIRIESMDKRLIKMAKQLEEMYYDTEPTEPNNDAVEQIEESFDEPDEPDEATIKRLGQRIAYNLMDDPVDVTRFRDFIYEAKTHPRSFTDIELKYIDIADKNFDDIRLSRKHLGILQDAYPKAYPGKVWPFRTVQGYLYKYGNHLVWQWFR